MAECSTYSQIPLKEHRSQPYPPAEVQPDEPDKSSIYHEEDGDKQPSHTLLENQQFARPESSSANNIVTSMVNPEVDTPPPYTSVEHICVATDVLPTNKSVPVLVDKPTSSASFVPYEPEYQRISATKTQRKDESPPEDFNYLCLAIFVCLCCFLPSGLLAISYARKASKARARGDYDTARTYNRWTLTWIVSSCICGIISVIFYLSKK
ncbi:transmembrane protein 91-like isoform X1 [Mytilus californianus]|uniref:transmembrane protein 91-like isoform X1 n=1 Tax=Mytilus californianus TaxID=6549 RepID=UPI002247A201|nr:transmembrane protein 91-like isoform X1 [Mytilus californianus]